MQFLRWITMLSVSAALLNSLLPSPASGAFVKLRWTTPGDDGALGRAASYDLRYSVKPITAANFASATAVPAVPTPKVAGVADSFTVNGLMWGSIYYFALKTIDEAHNPSPTSNVAYRLPRVLAAGDGATPLAFSGPWPNPALQSAHFAFALPEAAHIEVDAFDITGRRVRSIASGDREAGRGDLTWDLRDGAGRRVEPGIYLVHMTTPGGNWVRRLIVSG